MKNGEPVNTRVNDEVKVCQAIITYQIMASVLNGGLILGATMA